MTFKFNHVREPIIQGRRVLKVLTSGVCFSMKRFFRAVRIDQDKSRLLEILHLMLGTRDTE